MHSRQKWNMVSEKHCFIGKPCMVSKSKFNDEMGTSRAKTNCGYEKQDFAKRKEVGAGNQGSSYDHEGLILWHGKKDMLGGGASTSGCCRYQGMLIEMPSPSVKIHDSLPPGYVPLMQLQSIKEAETRKECGSNVTQTPTVYRKPQTNRYKALDIKEARLSVDMGTGDGSVDKKEARQIGIRDGVPDKNQQSQCGNSGACKGQTVKIGQKHDNETTNDKGPLNHSIEITGMNMEQHGYRRVFHVSKQRITNGKSGDMSKQEAQIGSLTTTERKASCQWNAYDRHKVDNGIVDHKWKWSVKMSPETSRTMPNDVHTCHRLEGPPLEGSSASKGITERSNQGRESFEDAKEVGGRRTGRYGFLVRGTNGEGEVDSKNVKNQDGVSNVLGDGCVSLSHPYCSNPSVNVQDSLPPGYVPLKQLQNSKESESRKECGSKIYISKQHPRTIFNKSLRDKDCVSDKIEQRQSGDTGVGDETLDKNDVTQTGGAGIKDGATDKNKQRERGNSGALKKQTGKSGKKLGTLGMNGKTNVDGASHGNVEASGMKLEQHDYKSSLEASKQRNQNKHKGPLLKGLSAVWPNQDTHIFENAKEFGGNGSRRHGFLGSGTDVEEEVNLKHAQNQYEVSEELEEGVVSASYPVCSRLSSEIQDSLHPRYFPLEKLQSSKEAETRKECGPRICISKQPTHTVFNKPLRNKDDASNNNEHKQCGDTGIRDGSLDKNERTHPGSLGLQDEAPDEHKERQSRNLGAPKGQTVKNGKIYETVTMNGKINVKGPLHGSVEMSNRNVEQRGGRNEVEASKQGNQYDNKGPLLNGASTSKWTTARPCQSRDRFAVRKEIGGNGNGRNVFFGIGIDAEGKANLKRGENKIISVSHPFSQNLNVKIQDSLPARYVALKQLQSSKESEIRKECGSMIYIPKQHTHTIHNKLERNKDNVSDKNEQRQRGY